MPSRAPSFSSWCAAAAAVVAGCGTTVAPPTVQEQHQLPVATAAREIDVLFVIDNSPGMGSKANLVAPAFEQLMSSLSTGGQLASLHVGVVTTDLGTSGGSAVGAPGTAGACDGDGEAGVMRTNGLALTDGARFLRDEPADGAAGARRRNFPGTLGAAFQQLASIEAVGCGFEQPLAATVAALRSPSNGTFLRATAQLAIVIVSDEDDCSATPSLFGSDPALGALSGTRCTRFGLVCDQDLALLGSKTNCHPVENSPWMQSVSGIVGELRALKQNPDASITFTSLSGPSSPVNIIPSADGTQRVLEPSCSRSTSGAPITGEPAVRIRAAASAFASTYSGSICDADYGSAFALIGGELLIAPQRAGCFTRTIAEPVNCAVADILGDQRVQLAACSASADNTPCWEVVHGSDLCATIGQGDLLELKRTSPAVPGTVTEIACEVN